VGVLPENIKKNLDQGYDIAYNFRKENERKFWEIARKCVFDHCFDVFLQKFHPSGS
jgi:hypothetical protein